MTAVRVAQSSDEHLLIVADCGCAWRVSADGDPATISYALRRALGHAEKGDPCFVPAGVIMTDPPGQLSVDQGVCQNSGQERCAHG